MIGHDIRTYAPCVVHQLSQGSMSRLDLPKRIYEAFILSYSIEAPSVPAVAQPRLSVI